MPETDRKHTCVICGHSWESLEDETAKGIRTAAKVNKQGPFCALCHHLEMASRYATERGFNNLHTAVEFWLHKRPAPCEPQKSAS